MEGGRLATRRASTIFRRLEYFEATARYGSITRAAKDFGVTPSAVSHQLADLRRTIEEDLFEKSGRTLVLTSAGKRLAERLSTAFSILEASVSSAIGDRQRVVSIATCSSFGPYWLTPRLGEFRKARPDIEIEMRLYARDPELTQASADVIVTARTVKPGYASLDLFEEVAIAVAAPGMVGCDRLDDVPLITTDTHESDLGSDWRELAAASGLSIADDPQWIRCSHYILALEAAKAGLGAAILPEFVARHGIDDGTLEDVGMRARNLEGRTYRACYKEARAGEPALDAVLAWLKRTSRSRKGGARPIRAVSRLSR